MPTLPLVVDCLSRLAARTITHAHYYVKGNGLAKRGDQPPELPTMPFWGMIMVFATAAIGVFFLITVQYTVGDLISTLAMIETPAAAVTFESVDSDEPDATLTKEEKEAQIEQAQTLTIVPVKPITSKIRDTLRHIRAIGGRRAPWRGFVPAVVYSFFLSISLNIFDAVIPRALPLRLVLIQTLAALPLARCHMAWTHVMISMPSEKSWFRRLAPCSAYRQLWLPTVISHLSGVYALFATAAFYSLVSGFGLEQTILAAKNGSPIEGRDVAVSALTIVGTIAFGIAMGLMVVLPAHVTLIRIEASMLPEEHETIVPFDRSFGGKVVPKVLGGTGAVGYLDAWRSFDWAARRRIIKLYVKNITLQFTTIFTLMWVLAAETAFIMGGKLKCYMHRRAKWEKEHAH